MIRIQKTTLFLSGFLMFNALTLYAQMVPQQMPSRAANPLLPDMAPMPPMGARQMSPTPSEQEMNSMVQELEKATKEIDNFVKALPPAEQEEFNRIVQQVEQKMSQTDPAVLERFLTNQMSPEELDQFLGNVFEGITPPQAAEEAPAAPKPTQKKEEKVAPKEISKIERALDTINAILKRTDSFVVKTQEIPELANKVKRWGKSGLVYDWEPSFEWDKVKKDIASLRQTLQKLIEKDPKNNTYKYLTDFVEQEKLVSNIEKLKTTLVEYEPVIETSVFGLDKANATVKKALTRTISGYTEALYRLKVIDDLNKIFEKYEPRAKELREEKEQAEKSAEAAGMRSRYAGRQEMTIAGGSGRSGDYYSGSYSPETDYSSFYSGSPSSYGSTPSYDWGSPSSYDSSGSGKTGGESDFGGDSSKGMSSGGSLGSSSSSNGNGGTSDETEEKEENGSKKSGKGKSDSSDKKTPPKKESESIEKSLKDIKDVIDVAGLDSKFDKILSDLKTYLEGDQPADTYPIEQQYKNLQEAEAGINSLKQEIDKEMDKGRDKQLASRVQKRLEDIVKERKPALDKLMSDIKTIDAMDQKEKETLISAEKRTLYLGQEYVVSQKGRGAQKAGQEKIEVPSVTLLSIPKAWEAVGNAIKDFAKRPEPVVPVTPVQPAPVAAPDAKAPEGNQ